MRKEPLFNKWCSCVPLRLCLQIWAGVKVVADIASAMYLIITMALFYNSRRYDFKLMYLSYDGIFTLIVMGLLVDLFFLGVLIAGINKKDHFILRIFFCYGICMILEEAVLLFVIVIWSIARSPPVTWNDMATYGVIFMVVGLLWIVLDIFILLTVRSETTKIRNKEQYDIDEVAITKTDEEIEKKYDEKPDKNELEERYLMLFE